MNTAPHLAKAVHFALLHRAPRRQRPLDLGQIPLLLIAQQTMHEWQI
jgi:hypothetical protein